MTLLDAPKFDEVRDRRIRAILYSSVGAVLVLLISFWLIAGHPVDWPWYWVHHLQARHTADRFLDAVEKDDLAKAYGIWMHDPDWQQHPQKFDYTLKRFTEDWTTESPVGPIRSHHVDISKTDGSGTFGTGIIVAVRVNGGQKLFMWYEKKDGTLTYPAPHELQY